MSMEDEGGASHNQRLLAAAREDNEELLQDVFQHEGKFDVNYQDGLGNTGEWAYLYPICSLERLTELALHYAAAHGSTTVLEYILSHEDCDVDPINRVAKATPLHLALTALSGEENAEARHAVAESLIEAGADTLIKDKNGDTALDLVHSSDDEIKRLIRKSRAEAALSLDDVTNDDDDDGSGSGSDTD
ncbi:hypothetical protein BDV98DRAFT_591203 [Pterulicium gracile]|uniref:Uncharacterized protein n=1 Tax=Pterulicium gracile TaxID=1884261 RepID=A0A5C3QNC3_9AGAR|nr:hypothetical protein BDV98DRAFT_591203 [Pterula gracilis]